MCLIFHRHCCASGPPKSNELLLLNSRWCYVISSGHPRCRLCSNRATDLIGTPNISPSHLIMSNITKQLELFMTADPRVPPLQSMWRHQSSYGCCNFISCKGSNLDHLANLLYIHSLSFPMLYHSFISSVISQSTSSFFKALNCLPTNTVPL